MIFKPKKKEDEVQKLKSIVFEHCVIDLDNLIANYPSEGQDASKKAKYEKEFLQLKEKLDHPVALSWNDLFEVELLIANLLPLSRLSRHVWQLRLRYRDVVGLAQYEAYLSSKPPELAPSNVDAKVYRADSEYLLTEIYVRYMLTPHNEKLRDDISRKVTRMILVGLLIIVIAAYIFGQTNGFNDHVLEDSLGPVNLVLVLFIGAMGGLCSMQQRYQSTPRDGDPVDNVLLLQQSWSRLFMPAISGAIFAALLYFIIIGGLLSGELFPKINAQTPVASETMLHAIKVNRPNTVADYAKLVIWAFLAGFAERLVPDTLTRFMATKDIGA